MWWVWVVFTVGMLVGVVLMEWTTGVAIGYQLRKYNAYWTGIEWVRGGVAGRKGF